MKVNKWQKPYYISNWQAKHKALRAIPVRTVDHCQIVPQKGKAVHEMLQRQIQLSNSLGTSCTLEGDTLVYEIN